MKSKELLEGHAEFVKDRALQLLGERIAWNNIENYIQLVKDGEEEIGSPETFAVNDEAVWENATAFLSRYSDQLVKATAKAQQKMVKIYKETNQL